MPPGRPYKCPYCGGTHTASKGVRKTKAMGLRKLRFCKSCRRKFTPVNQPAVQAEAPADAGTPVLAPVDAEAPVPAEEAQSIGATNATAPTGPENPTDEHRNPGP